MEEEGTRLDGGGDGTRLSGCNLASPRGRRSLPPKGQEQEGCRVRIKTFILSLFLLAGKCPTPHFLTCKKGTRMVLPLPDGGASSWF